MENKIWQTVYTLRYTVQTYTSSSCPYAARRAVSELRDIAAIPSDYRPDSNLEMDPNRAVTTGNEGAPDMDRYLDKTL